jgi:hypothetical protein
MNVITLAILVFIVYGTLSDWWLQKKFKIEKRKWGFYKSVNRLHKWIDGTVLVLFFIAYRFVENNYIVIICFILTIIGVRAFMEWKYENAKREYIMTLNTIFSGLLFFGLVYFII